MSTGLPMVDDLPRDARALLARAGTEIDEIQKAADAAIAAIQKTTNAQATRLQKQVEKEIANLRAQAEQEINTLAAECERKVRGRVAQVAAELEPLQQSYFQQAKLDETLAIRSQIRQLQENPTPAQPDPGNLVGLSKKVGKSFSFVVTGSTSGALWGTDTYTADSSLACAAVHAGKVQPGQTKVVRVTIVQPLSRYKGSTRNGVSSSSWGAYNGAYRVG